MERTRPQSAPVKAVSDTPAAMSTQPNDNASNAVLPGLPSSVKFKARGPSTQRMGIEMQRYNLEKQKSEEEEQMVELKKYAATMTQVGATSANGNANGSAESTMEQKLSEFQAHREHMVAEEGRMNKMADAMRKGKNRANETSYDFTLVPEKVPISLGTNKRDYSYIKESVKPGVDQVWEPPARPSLKPRPISPSAHAKRGITTGLHREPESEKDIQKKAKMREEVKKKYDDEALSVLLQRNVAGMTEEEKSIHSFLRANTPVLYASGTPREGADTHASGATTLASAVPLDKGKDKASEEQVPVIDVVVVSAAATSAEAGIQPSSSLGLDVPLEDNSLTDESPEKDTGGIFSQPSIVVDSYEAQPNMNNRRLGKSGSDSNKSGAIASIRSIGGPSVLMTSGQAIGKGPTHQQQQQRPSAPMNKSFQPAMSASIKIVEETANDLRSSPTSHGNQIDMDVEKVTKATAEAVAIPIASSAKPQEKAAVAAAAAATATAAITETTATATAECEDNKTTTAPPDSATLRKKLDDAKSLDSRVNPPNDSNNGKRTDKQLHTKSKSISRHSQNKGESLVILPTRSVANAIPAPHSMPELRSSAGIVSGTGSRVTAPSNGEGSNIILNNMKAQGTYKKTSGSVNAKLSSGFKADVGTPNDVHAMINSNRSAGTVSHLPSERVIKASMPLHVDGEHVDPHSDLLAIDDSCVMSPPQSALKGKNNNAPPSSPPLLSLTPSRPAQLPAHRGGTGNLGLFKDISNTVTSLANNRANSPTTSPSEELQLRTGWRASPPSDEKEIRIPGSPGSPSSVLDNAGMTKRPTSLMSMHDDLDDEGFGAGSLLSMDGLLLTKDTAIEEKEEALLSARIPSLILNRQDSKAHSLEEKSLLAEEKALRMLESAPQMTDEEIQQKEVKIELQREQKAVVECMGVSFKGTGGQSKSFVNLENSLTSSNYRLNDGYNNMSDYLTDSVMDMLNHPKDKGKLRIPQPSHFDQLGPASNNNNDTFKVNDVTLSRVVSTTKTSKAKMKIRGIESKATEYITAEEKRSQAKYALDTHTKHKVIFQEKKGRSSKVMLDTVKGKGQGLDSNSVVDEEETSIIDTETAACLSSLRKQQRKYARISDKNTKKREIDRAIARGSKQLDAEVAYEKKTQRLANKNSRRVLEYLDLTGVLGDGPGDSIGAGEEKQHASNIVEPASASTLKYSKKAGVLSTLISDVEVPVTTEEDSLISKKDLTKYNNSSAFSADYDNLNLASKRAGDITPTIVHLKHKLNMEKALKQGHELEIDTTNKGKVQVHYAPRSPYLPAEDSWEILEKEADIIDVNAPAGSGGAKKESSTKHSSPIPDDNQSKNFTSKMDSSQKKYAQRGTAPVSGKSAREPFDVIVADGLPDSLVLDQQELHEELKRITMLNTTYNSSVVNLDEGFPVFTQYSNVESMHSLDGVATRSDVMNEIMNNYALPANNLSASSPTKSLPKTANTVGKIISKSSPNSNIPRSDSSKMQKQSLSSEVALSATEAIDDSMQEGDHKSGQLQDGPSEMPSHGIGLGLAESTVAVENDNDDNNGDIVYNKSELQMGLAESTVAIRGEHSDLLDPAHIHRIAFESSGALAIGAGVLETSLLVGLGEQGVNNITAVPGSLEGGYDSIEPLSIVATEGKEKRNQKLSYLDKMGTSVASLEDGSGSMDIGGITENDSIFSYSRNQTQTIHAPALGGASLRPGYGIHHSSKAPLSSSMRAAADSGSGDSRRPGTNSKAKNPYKDVDATLDQQSTASQIKITGTSNRNNAKGNHPNTRSAIGPPGSANTLYSVNSTNFRNSSSIRDLRGAERHDIAEKVLLERTRPRSAAAAVTSSSKNASRGGNVSRRNAATGGNSVGLRIHLTKYGATRTAADDALLFDNDNPNPSALMGGNQLEETSVEGWGYNEMNEFGQGIIGVGGIAATRQSKTADLNNSHSNNNRKSSNKSQRLSHVDSTFYPDHTVPVQGINSLPSFLRGGTISDGGSLVSVQSGELFTKPLAPNFQPKSPQSRHVYSKKILHEPIGSNASHSKAPKEEPVLALVGTLASPVNIPGSPQIPTGSPILATSPGRYNTKIISSPSDRLELGANNVGTRMSDM